MSHENKLSLHQQVYNQLQSLEGYGRSKHDDKILRLTDKYIYSFSTMQTYMKHCNYFVKWCKENEEIREQIGHRPRTLEECEPYVEAFIRDREQKGFSAYTVKMELSALAKLYQKDYFATIRTISIHRADIKRSRGEAVRDHNFSEKNNRELINCCRCVGFRRMELEKCKPEDLWEVNGEYFVNIKGKGGKVRAAHVLGTTEEVQRAVAYIKTLTGDNYVHSAADIHSYRGDYATKIYNMYKGNIDDLRGKQINYTELTGKRNTDGSEIYKTALYYCKRDRKGVALDRRAMIIASQNLGHNRESVVGAHYINVK